MIILALDLSTKATGYAIYEDKKLIDYGLFKSSSTDLIKRIRIITKKLEELILNLDYTIDNIIAEEVPPSGNPKTFKALMFMQASVEFLAYDNKISIEYIYPNSWRSKCGIKTGRGASREELKQEDIKFAENMYELTGLTDDEADAICIGHSYFLEEIKEGEINW